MKDLILYLSLVSAIIFQQGLVAQLPCNPDSPPASESCEDAPILCSIDLLHNYCTTMSQNITGNAPSPLCNGGGAPHNVVWFAFVAGCTDLSLTLTPYNCVPVNGQIGIQAAIFGYGGNGLCPSSTQQPDETIWCLSAPCFTNPANINANGLTIGQIYYFMIDGCAGSYCDIHIAVNSPCSSNDLGPWESPIMGKDSVCIGETNTYRVTAPLGATNYTWYLEGSAIQAGQDSFVDITWFLEGDFVVCVDVSNSCVPETNDPEPLCKTISVHGVKGIDPPTVYICDGGSYPYPGGPYSAGVHVVNFPGPFGCDSIVTLTVLVDSATHFNQGTYYICAGESIELEGTQYNCNSTGEYTIYYQKETAPFCDSIIQYEVACFQSFIKPHGILNPNGDAVVLDGELAADASGRYFSYEWYTTNGVLPDTIDLPTLVVKDIGEYCLITTMYDAAGNVLCEQSACTEVRPQIELIPEIKCEEAMLLCDTRGSYNLILSGVITGNGPSPICNGGGAPHNTHWLAFYATCKSMIVRLTPSNCTMANGQIGIQAAIFGYVGGGKCTSSYAQADYTMACATTPCFTEPTELVSTNYTAGDLYYLFIDGCVGSICDVNIEFIADCDTLDIPVEWVGTLTGPDSLCEREKGLFTAPTGPEYAAYEWLINDSLIGTTNQSSYQFSVEEAGTYTLCTNLGLACAEGFTRSQKVCRELTILPSVNEAGRDLYLCADEYRVHHGVYWSCDFDGSQTITYSQKDDYGCDSMVTFNIYCLSPSVSIIPPEPIASGDSLYFLDGSLSYPGPPQALITWQWTAQNGGVIIGPTDQPTAIAGEAGLYCLTIEASAPNGKVICRDSACVEVTTFGKNVEPRGFSADADHSLRIYPVPASNRIWVEFQDQVPGAGVVVFYNALGQEVYRFTKGADMTLQEIEVSAWMPGIYTATLFKEEGREVVSVQLFVLHD